MINIVLETVAQTEFAFVLNDGINICGFFTHEASEHCRKLICSKNCLPLGKT